MKTIDLVCRCCDRVFTTRSGLSVHLRVAHSFTIKEYYDKYFKEDTDDKCAVCGNPTTFKKRGWRYNKFCSISCGTKYQNMMYTDAEREKLNEKRLTTIEQRLGSEFGERISAGHRKRSVEEKRVTSKKLSESHQRYVNSLSKAEQEELSKTLSKRSIIWHEQCSGEEKEQINRKKTETRWANIHMFEKANDCICVKTLYDIYGQGWKSLELPMIHNGPNSYIKNIDVEKIAEYSALNHRTSRSTAERELEKVVSTIYTGMVVTSSRDIIQPYELDIFLPDICLAIEYNGSYFHSDKAGKSEEYHLTKSIMCRERGIRLIHIYEFENFEEQKDLLISYLGGIDKYPEDFNKNNFLAQIPKPEIIYSDDRMKVFGAGKLVKRGK